MPNKSQLPEYIMTLTCADKPGIVAGIAGALAAFGCNIEESSQYGDPIAECFFLRVRFCVPTNMTRDDIYGALKPLAKRFAMKWDLYRVGHKTRTIIMVSKFDHCLNDLLYRWRVGSLPIDITRVVSNHDTCRDIVEHAGLEYTHIPVTTKNKAAAENKLRNLIKKDGAELVVLARYMQILSNELSNDFFGRIINIHHSFLPGFKGARPYHKAHARGVKLTGATAHYVTPDLDEGPIIEQETDRVDHAMTVNDLITAGRDIERRVLSRAIKYHTEHRVLVNGGKTVIFK